MSLLRRKNNKNTNYIEFQHDLADDKSTPSCEKIGNLNGDPQMRYVNLGIVQVVEPLKNEILHPHEKSPMSTK